MITPRQAVTATQADTIRAHLMTGATISTWDAYELYRITCLAQRIHELRRSGINIKSKVMTQNGKRFSLYWVEAEDLARHVSGQVNTFTDVRGTGKDEKSSGTTNEKYDSLASIDEATKGHRAILDNLAAINASDGVWLPHDYIDNFLFALITNSKALNLLAQLSDIEGTAEADKINDYSMQVSDIAMSLTIATTNVRPHPNSPCISGTWLARDYLKRLKLSIDGNSNGLGAMAITATLTNTDLNDGVIEASMRLAEISTSIEGLISYE